MVLDVDSGSGDSGGGVNVTFEPNVIICDV